MTTKFEFNGTGVLEKIETFTTKAGKNIVTLIMSTASQYPQLVPIKCFGHLADGDYRVGDTLRISGELGGRDWNGKVFGDITARNIKVVEKGKGKDKAPVDTSTKGYPGYDKDEPLF
jgi:hypothetical protein